MDGANSLPLRIDRAQQPLRAALRRPAGSPHRVHGLGAPPRRQKGSGREVDRARLHSARRVAPTSSPTPCKRLSGEATHLYVDGRQYWYSLIPNVTRIAADRANSNYKDIDADDEVRRRIDAQRDRGSFAAVQVFAEGPGDVPDNDDGVRLVVLEPDATHSPNDANSPAVALAGKILAQRDAGPRLNRNLVVFVAAAANRLAELRAAARLYLAWKSIVADQESMNLTPHQLRQAESKLQETSKQVDSLIGETFTLTLTPSQSPGTSEIDWPTTRATAVGGPRRAGSASKLVSEEKLIATYSGVRIRMDLDRREPMDRPRRHGGAQAVGDLHPVPPHAQARQPRRALQRDRQQGRRPSPGKRTPSPTPRPTTATAGWGCTPTTRYPQLPAACLVHPDRVPADARTAGA